MNAAAAPAPADGDLAASHATEDADQAEEVAPPPTSKRNTAEDLGLICLGALLLAAARGALDLGLTAEARTTLSVAACCAVLAGAIFLFRDAGGRFMRGRRRRRREQQQPPATAGAVRRKIEGPGEEEGLDEQPSSASDRLSRSPSSDVGPHGAATTHEPQPVAQVPVTPESSSFIRRTSSAARRAYNKQPAAAEKPTTPEPSPRRTSRPRKPSRRYSSGDWEL